MAKESKRRPAEMIAAGDAEAIRRGPWLTNRRLLGDDPLVTQAVKLGNLELVEALLDKGASINLTDVDKKTPLHHAVIGGMEEIAARLLQRGARVSPRDKFGCIPLHYAADASNARVVKLLLEAGTRINVVNGEGHTPLSLVRRRLRYLGQYGQKNSEEHRMGVDVAVLLRPHSKLFNANR